MTKTPGSFYTRNSSGLVREFRLLDVFIFNLLGFSPGFSILVLPNIMGGSYPAANVSVVLFLGLVLSICNGLTYAMLATVMPRSGGDYIFISRTFRPWVGFTASWTFLWSQLLGLGFYAGLLATDTLAPGLTVWGSLVNNPSLRSLGQTLQRPWPVFMVGSAAVFVVFVCSCLGMRLLKRIMWGALAIAATGTLAMAWTILASDRTQFVNNLNVYLQGFGIQDGYNAVLLMAARQGVSLTSGTSWLATLYALPAGYWVFIGFTYSAYVGGEVSRPARSQTLGIIGALLAGYTFYATVTSLYYNVVGREFIQAVSVIKDQPGSPFLGGGSMLFFAGLMASNRAVVGLMVVSSIIWFVFVLIVIAQVCIRTLFAWSFDKLMPEFLTKVSGRGAPWGASLVTTLVAECFVALYAFRGITFLDYIIAMFSVTFLISGIAAMSLPFRRPALFSGAPAFVRYRIGSIPLISLAGAGNTLLFVIILYSCFFVAGVTGPGGWSIITAVLGLCVAGAALYAAIVKYRSKHDQIDLEVLYEELPPE